MTKCMSFKVAGSWRVMELPYEYLPEAACAIIYHNSEGAGIERIARATCLELAGNISPADLMIIREKLGMNRPTFANKCHVAVRTIEDYESAKRRISPVVYELARRIGVDNE